ncbi:IclR family transcriptional regulator [Mycolicibacterium chubuense]|uniref:Glycerol operon regulatory protein n=1 Tax=Mycolicibacterium chubuense TaxID=1800 RepID=A0A0J6YM85_MYCCU|nr:IclR family transcriptional regulator [Mycolicibacterium chubuense]KMO73871.1 HTH-type transcriptional regulator KipR [Mycolicibacterium chubuense]ORA48217.1 IclR family transcriptional regulator [Mycolicibacterium chubuense]SPX97673.1 IclR family transcriptional regulator [Mycolicibacterium chubuense]
MGDSPAQRPAVTVAGRALSLLGAFDEEHRRLTLTELSDRTGLPRPTAHRLIAELVSWGALARDADGHYVVGRRLWDVGMLAPVQRGLHDIASPYLHDLYAATHATVHLAVRDDLTALYVDRLMGHASVPVVSSIGSRLPLHATGVGKVLLAHAPQSVITRVLADLTPVTPYTVTQPGRMNRQLARVREHGYAVTREEMSLGACSLAVPIVADGAVVAALGIVVPTLESHLTRLTVALRVAAGGIGRSLDHERHMTSGQ